MATDPEPRRTRSRGRRAGFFSAAVGDDGGRGSVVRLLATMAVEAARRNGTAR